MGVFYDLCLASLMILFNVSLQYFHRVDDEWVFKTPLQHEQTCPSV